MRNLFFIIGIILFQVSSASGQLVWPGDINNNGIVNNIDVLYWAVAKDATGDGRLTPSSDWTDQNLPANLWGQSFPNGLNYAYADCDGDGDVDDDDKTVIEENFGKVHDTLIPDVYTSGDPAFDPILQLSSDMTNIAPKGTLEADLSLGAETDSISSFYGIAFTITYDPDVVGDQGNDFRLNILEDTWMNGQGDDKVIQFINNDKDNGIAQIAIARKNQVPVSGFGDIGTLNIVMEDIVVGFSKITTTDIQMVDLGLVGSPIAASELEFSTDSTLTVTVRPILREGVKLFPNPVDGQWINVELKDQTEKIRRVQMFDMNGRLLRNQFFGEKTGRQRFHVGQFSRGVYTMKIYTDKHLYVQSFFK